MRGAYAVLSGLDNRRYTPELETYLAALPPQLSRRLTSDFIAADPILQGFRDLHYAVGRSNKRFVSSAESLVGLFLRKGMMPRINPLVDIYNAVSLETQLSLGAHDLVHVTSDITLRRTTGSERFVPLSATQAESIHPGEYCYCDDLGNVLCRLEHRQCDCTKVTHTTTQCFYILQGNAHTTGVQINSALARLVELTTTYCGGKLEHQWIEGGTT